MQHLNGQPTPASVLTSASVGTPTSRTEDADISDTTHLTAHSADWAGRTRGSHLRRRPPYQ
jgi:hypothetical protein